jgi:hypothetical protein
MPRRATTPPSADAAEVCTCTSCGRVYTNTDEPRVTHVGDATRAGQAVRRGRRVPSSSVGWPPTGRLLPAVRLRQLSDCTRVPPHRRTREEVLDCWCHTRAWISLCRERDACVLLCQNCHAEVHDEAVQSGLSYWNRDRALPPATPDDEPPRTCRTCGRRYLHDFRRGHTRLICNSCRSNGARGVREGLKRRLVDHKGGRCELCGYE